MDDILEKIHESALRFLVPLNSAEVYEILVNEAVKLVKAEYGSLILENNGKFERVYSTLPIAPKLKFSKNGFTWSTFKDQKIRIKKSKDHQGTKIIYNLGLKSNVFIPLSYRKKSIGVLIVNSFENTEFTKNEIKTLKLFGSLASLAIRKTQLYEETKKALDDRDLFISMAAHELRTPLTTLSGYIQLLGVKYNNQISSERRWVQHMLLESHRLTQLIDELLSVNKIQSGSFSYEWKECSLTEVVNKAISDFEYVYPDRKIGLVNKLSFKNDIIVGDKVKLLQVVTNLLDNAAKFSDLNSEINLQLHQQYSNIVLTVGDKGRGISKKDLPKIFDGFYIGKNHQVEGMGLGLFLAKNIIEKHHGQIKVKSKVNFGTDFLIKLPKVKI